MEADADDEPFFDCDTRLRVGIAVSPEPSRVARPVRVGNEQADAAVPVHEQVGGCIPSAALVVDHDRVARGAGQAAVNLHHADAVAQE